MERDIKELDKAIREARSHCGQVVSLTEKLAAQKQMKTLEAKRNKLRQELYDQQDSIDAQRDDLISEIEKQLKQQHTLLPLLKLRWKLV